MTDRIIEGKWCCTSCGNKEFGRYKKCQTCGNPREDDVEMRFDWGKINPDGSIKAPTVTDPALLALNAAGADKFCKHCRSGNVGTGDRCESCGADLTCVLASITESKRLSPDNSSVCYEPTETLSQGASKLGLIALCKRSLALLQCALLWYRGFKPLHRKLVGGAIALILLLLWAFSTHDVPGRCFDKGWTRSATRETFTRVVKEDWKGDIPNSPSRMPIKGSGEHSGAENIRNCKQKIHHYDRVQTGTRTEHYSVTESYACGQSCSVRNNRNGFATESCSTKHCNRSVLRTRQVPIYREDPAYRSWCTYDTYKWVRHETRVISGGAKDRPIFPELAVGPADRVILTQSYIIHFAYQDGDDARYSLNTVKLNEYESWQVGDIANIVINNLGMVRGVHKT